MSFRDEYAAAFAQYVAAPDETALRTAYDLGRTAVERGFSVLDLASLHHDVVLSHTGDGVVGPAGEFFLESLAAFELLQRSLAEAREEARLEQRQAALLRQLSNFLADASLATNSAESTSELLQLVAEQTLELVRAECCIVEVSNDRAVCHDGDAADWCAFAERAPLDVVYPDVRDDRGVVRLNGRALEAVLTAGRPSRGWLAAPLTALDGRALGLLHLFDKPTGAFSDVDEALVVELAQMASAAVERMQQYSEIR